MNNDSLNGIASDGRERYGNGISASVATGNSRVGASKCGAPNRACEGGGIIASFCDDLRDIARAVRDHDNGISDCDSCRSRGVASNENRRENFDNDRLKLDGGRVFWARAGVAADVHAGMSMSMTMTMSSDRALYEGGSGRHVRVGNHFDRDAYMKKKGRRVCRRRLPCNYRPDRQVSWENPGGELNRHKGK